MGSTDRHEHHPFRTAARWLPALILAVTAIGATGVMLQIDGPGSRDVGGAAIASDTPILSLRRQLDPLADAAADRVLATGLDAFVATQPADTCLQVEVGDLRYAHRADDPQAPASVQKLLTAVAALTELGPDHVYLTDVLASPPVDGVVPGDLYLRGSGDPLLSTPAYAARERNQPQIYSNIELLAEAIVASGVRGIFGGIVGDESHFDAARYNPAWPSRFIGQGQIGPLSALSVNDGFAFFPENGNAVFGAAPEPAAYAAAVLDGALRARGVVIVAEPRAGATPADLDVVATQSSPTVAEIVVQMLRESDNNTAELLVKELGVRRSGEGTFAAGQAAMAEILSDAGFDLSQIAIADGSGLAIEDAVTCDFVVDLLAHEPTRDMIRDSLSVAGENGTLVRRWADTDLAGRIRAKTGTLNQVTALAGVADTAGDASARFALIVNLPRTEVIQRATVAAQEQLAALLVTHPRTPDVESLRPAASAGG